MCRGLRKTAGLWFEPFLCNGSLEMGKTASLRPPMPLVAMERWWVAMAAGLCSANFPIPLLPNQGEVQVCDTPTIRGNEGCVT